jgi:hypothetical protein
MRRVSAGCLPSPLFCKTRSGARVSIALYRRVAISNQRLIALDERRVTFCWKGYREKGAPAIRSLPSVRMSSCAFSCSMRCPWLPPHPSVRPARQPGASESRENTELPHVTAAQRAGRCGSQAAAGQPGSHPPHPQPAAARDLSSPDSGKDSGRAGKLRSSLPRGLSNACPHASSSVSWDSRPRQVSNNPVRRTTFSSISPDEFPPDNVGKPTYSYGRCLNNASASASLTSTMSHSGDFHERAISIALS